MLPSGDAGAPAADCGWIVCDPDALRWRSWDGEVVVYCDADGRLHLLGPLAGFVLVQLLSFRAGLRSQDLVDRLPQSVHDVDATPDDVDQALEGLRQIELVRAVLA